MESQSDADELLEEIVEPEEENFQNRKLEEETVSKQQQTSDQSSMNNVSTVSTKTPHDTTNNNSKEAQEAMVQQQDELSTPEFPCYQKRSGTTDHGKEFEYLVCTYYSLKLLNDPNVKDFKMTTNSKMYGDLDDVEMTITYSDQTKHTFLMQLKHTESSERTLTDKMLNKNKHFNLQKYFKSFKNLKNRESISCILFTNRETQIKNNTTVSLDFAKVTSAKCRLNNAKRVLLDTTGNPNSCFHFKLEEQQEHSVDETEFFQCFCLLTNQKNYIEIKSLIDEMLCNMFGCEIEFTSFMQQWWQSNFVLTKHDVIVKLAELALSPFIQEISENVNPNSVLEKTKLLRNAITKFEMTLVKDYYEDTIGQIWEGISDKPENISKASLKYGVTSTSKILWYLNQVPLIVKYDDKKDKRFQGAIRLLEKNVCKNKIIILTNKTKEEFPEWKIFENLHDLHNEEIKCYNDIIENFKISLQGRPSIYLKQLFDSNLKIDNVIEVSQLFLMLEEDFCVGKKAQQLPEAYIPRSISALLLDTEEFLDYFKSLEDALLIINYSHNNDLKNVTKLTNAQTIHFESLSQFNINYNNLIVLAADNKCTKSSFEEICKKYNKSTIYLIQIIDKRCSMLVDAKENISSLKTMQYKANSLKENQLYSVFKNTVNIVIGQPGIGKSTLLRYLSQNCPEDCWCVLVNLIEHSSFLSERPSSNEILNEFLKNECPFFVKTKNQFQDSGRLYLLLDGLDEIKSDCVQTVLDSIEDLSSSGIKFWISSRENLKETIVKQFNTFTIDIEEVTEEKQRKYIHDRLINKYTKEEIDKIISIIFTSISISHNVKNILGVPLQLHIITEILLNDRKIYKKFNENIFVLSKMYRLFFEGKNKHLLKTKAEAKRTDILDGNLEHTLEQYEVPALKTCLDDDTFNKLKLGNSREINKCKTFLKVLQNKGDKLGIISNVIGENQALQAIFSHQSFAEYFACVWLKNNVDRLRLIKDDFFDIKYQSVRLIFDIMLAEDYPLHLAVLYKNPEQVKKNLERCKEKDEGGRNALHLICSYGAKYNNNNHYYWKTNRDTMSYIKIFEIISNCNFVEKDELFNLNCMDYALKCQCLFPFEIECTTRIDDLIKHLSETKLAYLCAYCGYTNILKTLIQKDKNPVKYVNFLDETLLHAAVRGLLETDETDLKHKNIETIKMLQEYGCDINIGDKNKNTPLHLVCKANDFYAAKVLLKNGACVNALNNINENALHLALDNYKKIDINLIKLLLDYKVEVDVESNFKDIPLHQVCSYPNKNVLKLIILSGANVNLPNKYGNIPLRKACRAGIYDNVVTLINAGADINSVTLHDAFWEPNSSINVIISFLLEKKLDINAIDSNGNTPLHLACKHGSYDIFTYLVQNGANINIVNNNKATMLHCASACVSSRRTDPEIIRFLLNNGINLEDIDSQGYTALQEACYSENYIAVKELIESGANVKVTTKSKETLLHLVSKGLHRGVSNNTADIIRLLTEKGLKTNDVNEESYTALHESSRINNYEAARALIDYGSNVNALTNTNDNALHILVQSKTWYENKSVKIIKLLIASGIDVNQANNNGYTPIQKAIKKCSNVSYIKALLDSNNGINIKTSENETLLHLAAKRWSPNIRIINCLLRRKVNINAVNKEGYTALHYACKKQALERLTTLSFFGVFTSISNYDEVKFLVDSGAKVDALTNNNETTLLLALKKTKPDLAVVQLLLSKCEGLVNMKDKNGMSPLLLAYKFKNWTILDFLLRKNILLDHETRDLLIEGLLNVLTLKGVKLLQLLLKNISNVEKIKIDDTNLIPNFPLHLTKRNDYLQVDLLLEMVGYIEEFYTINPTSDCEKDFISYIIKMFEKSNTNTITDHHPSTSRTTIKPVDVINNNS